MRRTLIIGILLAARVRVALVVKRLVGTAQRVRVLFNNMLGNAEISGKKKQRGFFFRSKKGFDAFSDLGRCRPS